ncbi:hypothetical protein MRX96_057229 [Rhipicephalus microplus]
MPDGECCAVCSGLISQTEDFICCEHCYRRAHVSCIQSSVEHENLQDHCELHRFGEVGSYAEATPMPNEVLYNSSAVSAQIPEIAVHPLNVLHRFAAAEDLIRKAEMGIQHIEHNLALLRAGRQLERRRILQAKLRMRSLCEDLSSEPVPLQVQLSIVQYEPSRDQEVLAAMPPVDCPAFGDTDDEEDV